MLHMHEVLGSSPSETTKRKATEKVVFVLVIAGKARTQRFVREAKRRRFAEGPFTETAKPQRDHQKNSHREGGFSFGNRRKDEKW